MTPLKSHHQWCQKSEPRPSIPQWRGQRTQSKAACVLRFSYLRIVLGCRLSIVCVCVIPSTATLGPRFAFLASLPIVRRAWFSSDAIPPTSCLRQLVAVPPPIFFALHYRRRLMFHHPSPSASKMSCFLDVFRSESQWNTRVAKLTSG